MNAARQTPAGLLELGELLWLSQPEILKQLLQRVATNGIKDPSVKVGAGDLIPLGVRDDPRAGGAPNAGRDSVTSAPTR